MVPGGFLKFRILKTMVLSVLSYDRMTWVMWGIIILGNLHLGQQSTVSTLAWESLWLFGVGATWINSSTWVCESVFPSRGRSYPPVMSSFRSIRWDQKPQCRALNVPGHMRHTSYHKGVAPVASCHELVFHSSPLAWCDYPTQASLFCTSARKMRVVARSDPEALGRVIVML